MRGLPTVRAGELGHGGGGRRLVAASRTVIPDLLRKRSQLVRQATMNLLSIQNLFARNRGQGISANRVKQLTLDAVSAVFEDANVALAIQSNVQVLDCLREQISVVERAVHGQVKLRPGCQKLLTVPGRDGSLGIVLQP